MTDPLNILVTGASGFVGAPLCLALCEDGHGVTAMSRNGTDLSGVTNLTVKDFANSDMLTEALAGVDVIVHAAARVHVMDETAADPLAEFRAVNRDMTLDIARAAHEAGVKRFVFLSSIKVFGETSPREEPFTSATPPRPADPYGVSKLEAEQALIDFAQSSGREVVVIRPPLIYGPGVRANFERMVRLVKRGLPLPFGGIRNRRSLVALDNLIDLIKLCATSPNAPGHVFCVSDGNPMSTPELFRAVGQALNRPVAMIAIPEAILAALFQLIGKSAYVARLISSLHVDISHTRDTLGWVPKVKPADAIRETVNDIINKEA